MHTLFNPNIRFSDHRELTPGTTVRVHQTIKEGNKTRVQIYEGLIVARHGKKTIDANIRVRRMAAGNVGVERIFPIFSPLIEKIEVVKRAKRIRRAKLNYIRNSKGEVKMREYQVGKVLSIYKDSLPEVEVIATEENIADETLESAHS